MLLLSRSAFLPHDDIEIVGAQYTGLIFGTLQAKRVFEFGSIPEKLHVSAARVGIFDRSPSSTSTPTPKKTKGVVVALYTCLACASFRKAMSVGQDVLQRFALHCLGSNPAASNSERIFMKCTFACESPPYRLGVWYSAVKTCIRFLGSSLIEWRASVVAARLTGAG